MTEQQGDGPDGLLWNGSRFRVGTSGYSFDDWVGPFYPPGTPKGGMLDYYSTSFDTVEVNSTYYRILHPRVMEHMAAKTPDSFRFFVKLHGSMTHSRDATDSQWADYGAMLGPLRESGKLEGLLAQFPYSFRPCDDSLGYLEVIAERTRGSAPVSVELRHRDWYVPSLRPRLAGLGVSLVSVDLPAIGNLPPREALVEGEAPGYVRFHGRNARTWWKGGAERYDWDYTREELSAWLPELARIAASFPAVFLFFNNCHAGQAVKSAGLMRNLLLETESDK
ncbi:DUF72 domain-containing protein [Candidatus Fermentibacterales bacterium]|nr:DUF72 domain-containing protein [Candidatus Fermentibacterales bacterium]